ncbi:phosphoribosyltransferase-like protein [Chytridium lagenaria]|nr:phosphoribosyltransferase-like protein [Chytridium lagenaria]
MSSPQNWIDIKDEQSLPLSNFLVPTHYADDVEICPHSPRPHSDRVEKLAHDIAKDCVNPVVACCVLKGASVFFADLMANLKKLKNSNNKSIPLSFEFIKVKSYENDQSTGNRKSWAAFRGKDLLIVEDIVDSGQTMVALINRLRQYEPASIKVVSLLLKKTPRSNKYIPDYVGFAIPDLFVVGYALDYNETGKVKYATGVL